MRIGPAKDFRKFDAKSAGARSAAKFVQNLLLEARSARMPLISPSPHITDDTSTHSCGHGHQFQSSIPEYQCSCVKSNHTCSLLISLAEAMCGSESTRFSLSQARLPLLSAHLSCVVYFSISAAWIMSASADICVAAAAHSHGVWVPGLGRPFRVPRRRAPLTVARRSAPLWWTRHRVPSRTTKRSVK